MANNRIDDYVGPQGHGDIKPGRENRAQIKIGWKITSLVTIVFIFLAAANIVFTRKKQ